MELNSKIYVSGHTGMVGSAILRLLKNLGYSNIVYRTSKELDLRNQQEVLDFFNSEKPEYVFLASAKVGGIKANNEYKAEFIYDNLMITTNVIHSSYIHKVKKLINLGSSCIFPKNAEQPINEDSLLSGYLEETNEAYAIAKITGIKLCQFYNQQYKTNYISLMPTNLYGYNDNYNPETSHLIPAIIRKLVNAKENNETSVTFWGTGENYREFMFADDLADACIYFMKNIDVQDIPKPFVNVGYSRDYKIKEVIDIVKSLISYDGYIEFDGSLVGTERKLMDSTLCHNLGWKPKINLEDGLKLTLNDYISKLNKG